MGVLKIFRWKENERMPDGSRAPYDLAMVCPQTYGVRGHLTTLSPQANTPQELDSYVDSLITQLEEERRKAHKWFAKREALRRDPGFQAEKRREFVGIGVKNPTNVL